MSARATRAASPLAAYVPRMVVDWLADPAAPRHRSSEGTAVFADISGFTALTEVLAARGRVGAEDMGDTLNLVFGALLGEAYDRGAALLKWGGDAVLLWFDGDHHVERAAATSWAMQRVIDRVGRLRVGGSRVTLRMSIGVHTDVYDFYLVGEAFRDLVVTGPAVSVLTGLETIAQAGEVVLGTRTAAELALDGTPVHPHEDVHLLVGAPTEHPSPERPGLPEVDLEQAMSAHLAGHLLSGGGTHEHRRIAVAFLEFSGVDALRREVGTAAVEEALHQLVARVQALAAAYDVTYLASDIYPDGGKIILAAGAPRATGDDPGRVLVAITEAVSAGGGVLRLRAGVNLGLVFAGDYGTEHRRVYSVTGDCVNLAARLMGRAGPGQVVASAGVLAATATGFDTEPLEPFLVKGKTRPVEASLVLGRVHQRVRRAVPSPWSRTIGREEELRLLAAAWSDAAAGRGGAVELVGEAGSGKSTLVEELAQVTGARVVRADGDAFAVDVPYVAFHGLWESLLFDLTGRDQSAAPDRAVALLDVLTRRAPATLPWAHLIGLTAGVDLPASPEVEALEPAARRDRMARAVVDALTGLLDGPALVVFHDTDAMDEASTDLLDRVVLAAPERAWLVVVTRQPDGEWQLAPESSGRHHRLTLGPLSPRAADALVSSLLGPHATHGQIGALVARAAGNPLHLVELATAVRQGVAVDEVPDSVEGMLSARIDRLPPVQRDLLRTAAVLGTTVEEELLAQLRDSTPEEVRRQLAKLDGYLVPESATSWRFAHALVRDTAYAGLPFRRRRDAHARAAALLEAGSSGQDRPWALLALHTHLAEDLLRATEYAEEAARQATQQYALREAAGFYRRAIDAARRLPAAQRDAVRVGRLWAELAWVHEAMGEIAEMSAAVGAARRRLPSDGLIRARLARMSSIACRQSGDYRGALRWTRQGLRHLEGREDLAALRLRARLSDRYAQTRLAQGLLAEAGRWAEQAQRDADLSGDPLLRAASLQTRAAVDSMRGRRVDVDALVAGTALYGDRVDSNRARAHNVIGVIAQGQQRWPLALEHYERAAALHEQLDRPLDVALMRANSAEILVSQGRLDDAERLLDEAMLRWRGSATRSERAFGLTQQARLWMARGDFVAALKAFEEARSVQVEVADHYEVVVIDGLLAECALLAGDHARVLAQLEEVEVGNRLVGAPTDGLDLVRGLALVGLGRTAAGWEAVRAALAAARRTGSLVDEHRCLTALVTRGVATAAEEDELAVRGPQIAHTLGLLVPTSDDRASAQG